MKSFINFFAFLIIGSGILIAQQASEYFPQQPGHLWYYKITPLDSLNNEIDSLSAYRIDSFAVVSNYAGREAKVILSKTAAYNTVTFLPYSDSEYVHLTGTEGFEYLKFANIDLDFLDSLNINANILESLRGWYSVYRFVQNTGETYQIFSKDTAITLDSTTVPLRIKYDGERLADENLNTQIGSFLTKKFIVTLTISYLFSFPPFPPIPIDLVTILDTVWIAPDNWIVKSVIPSTNVDLTALGYGSYFIPGTKREASPEIVVSGIDYNNFTPSEFILEQNYPNPFNPSTVISWQLSVSSHILLKVFDILGNEIAILVNEEKPAGEYKVEFNAEGLPNGIYFYKIQFNKGSLNRKMVLLK